MAAQVAPYDSTTRLPVSSRSTCRNVASWRDTPGLCDLLLHSCRTGTSSGSGLNGGRGRVGGKRRGCDGRHCDREWTRWPCPGALSGSAQDFIAPHTIATLGLSRLFLVGDLGASEADHHAFAAGSLPVTVPCRCLTVTKAHDDASGPGDDGRHGNGNHSGPRRVQLDVATTFASAKP